MERGRGGVSCLSCDFFCSLLSMNFRVLTICFAFPLFFCFCVFAITLQFPEKVSEICLSSVTVRLFKLPDLEDQSEDYRLAARYLGTISSSPNLRPAEVISYFSLPPPLNISWKVHKSTKYIFSPTYHCTSYHEKGSSFTTISPNYLQSSAKIWNGFVASIFFGGILAKIWKLWISL